MVLGSLGIGFHCFRNHSPNTQTALGRGEITDVKGVGCLMEVVLSSGVPSCAAAASSALQSHTI